jgi:hypothetical protein
MSQDKVEMGVEGEEALTESTDSQGSEQEIIDRDLEEANVSVDAEKQNDSNYLCFSCTIMQTRSLSQRVKKYETYDLPIDPLQHDRASTIKLCSFKRPHMRAFHFAWWSYHVAFLMWYVT